MIFEGDLAFYGIWLLYICDSPDKDRENSCHCLTPFFIAEL